MQVQKVYAVSEYKARFSDNSNNHRQEHKPPHPIQQPQSSPRNPKPHPLTPKMRSTTLLSLLTLLPIALAYTVRTASIKIQNNTPNNLTGLSISHKYSNVYKEQYDWLSLAPGATTPDPMTATYHTCFLCTGRDWWLLTYHPAVPSAERPGQLQFRYTAPKNFRNIIDALERAAPGMIKAAINLAKGSNPAALPAAKAAQVVSKAMCKLLFNTESTDGFKQHILTDVDAGRVTTFVVQADGKVQIKSRSGSSETVTEARWVEAEHA
jgi:hypothetical protein